MPSVWEKAKTVVQELSTDAPPAETTTNADVAPVAVPMPSPSMEMWAQLIEALKSNKEADTEIAASIHAKAMKKALRPENEVAPMISCYSYPEGDTLRPRPKPTHIFNMGPYPIADSKNYDTVTVTEIELLNQLEAGDYLVTKADGLQVKCAIVTEFESNGRTPYRTTLRIPMADDDQKNNWPPLVQLLTEITTGETPMQSYARYQSVIDNQAARIAALEAQLVAAPA